MSAKRSLRPIVSRPSVLVCDEKHGNRYLPAKDDAEMFRSALKVLGERLKDGYWYTKPDGKAPEKPDVDESEIGNLPVSLQATDRQLWKRYEAAIDARKEELAEYAAIERAVSERDGELAWRILRSRRDYQYEGVMIVELEEVDP